MKDTDLVNLEIAIKHGLTAEEYEMILNYLGGRTPNFAEIGAYSVMWSEHCSYKNSIAELKTLPRSGPKTLVEAGEENAGLVDIGNGLAVAFKIESHNHPSAVEPYQGAATGVGGILRDIFTMGARPVAALNSLRFGDLNEKKNKFYLKNVVKGIGDYGNSFGVPTVGGEIYFNSCYNGNPLVNAMAVGIVKIDKVAKAISSGVGNSVMIVGSSTGRDGIHGATFASVEISEESESKRPSVQVGDPFTEKLLLEATLEVIENDLIVGIQDMGAAGIICSTSEMSARGKSGMEINLDLVPVRDKNMSAYEILLSESQERMLLVAKPNCEKKIIELLSKWDLPCVTIGKVTEDDNLKFIYNGELCAKIPADSLVLGGGAPVYKRESEIPEYYKVRKQIKLEEIPPSKSIGDDVYKILSSPNIFSKKWVTTQYDSMVQTNTINNCIDGAVIRIKGENKILVSSTDCNSNFVYSDPYIGAQIAVAESARNVISMGATPLGITNCLNFGNPYKKDMFWQFKEAVRGLGDACRKFKIPVTGGNVSFYNESTEFSVFPTPVIGMLGLIDDGEKLLSNKFNYVNKKICVIGKIVGDLNSSEYMRVCKSNSTTYVTPYFNLDEEYNVCQAVLFVKNYLLAAHDISDGGLIVSLLESLFKSNVGADLNFTGLNLELNQILFGEEQSRFLVLVELENIEKLVVELAKFNTGLTVIGETNDADYISINDGEVVIDIKKADDIYFNSLSNLMEN